METFVRRFLRASLLWFGFGVLLGLAMAFWPMDALAYRPAHAHAHLLGFVGMMIFGVAYHVIPRFAAAPLPSRRLPAVHFWLANLGLAAMVGGWMVRVELRGVGAALLGAGGLLTAAGALLFIYSIWRTLDGAPEPVRPPGAERRPGSRGAVPVGLPSR